MVVEHWIFKFCKFYWLVMLNFICWTPTTTCWHFSSEIFLSCLTLTFFLSCSNIFHYLSPKISCSPGPGWGGGGASSTRTGPGTGQVDTPPLATSNGQDTPQVACQWRIQDFPEEGALTPKGGVPTYYLANFCRKLHENEEILGQRGGRVPRGPP